MIKRLSVVFVALVMGYLFVMTKLAVLMKQNAYAHTALQQQQFTVIVGTKEGTIYDRNFQPLVNAETIRYAVCAPTADAVSALLPHLAAVQPLVEGLRQQEAFAVEIAPDAVLSENILTLEIPKRYSERPLAQHVIGYTVDGAGVTGLERDFDRILRSAEDTASVTYHVDARRQVLLGKVPLVQHLQDSCGSVVTTLDADVQKICEDACRRAEVEKGAVVVMDVRTGDVLAMASFPSYTPWTLAEALEDENSPLINRCLYAYSVGSIFKLVTAAAAYEQGLSDFVTTCTGKTEIGSQTFRCHDWRGHGEVTVRTAMTYSCNSYFVEQSRLLAPKVMLETAQNLGFGVQSALSSSIVGASGTLPTETDLALPAEMANFCFGQGLLTATPLQVTQMVCGIANNGEMPLARLIAGYTLDGETVENAKPPMYAKALSRHAAYFLQNLMIAAINENESSNAVPTNVFAAAKTSTAQTGRYDENGVEYCHAWITGYFPIEEPTYAVTVLVEDGGYGNDAAAPIFREIAEEISEKIGSSPNEQGGTS